MKSTNPEQEYTLRKLLAALALVFVAAACGRDNSASSDSARSTSDSLQLVPGDSGPGADSLVDGYVVPDSVSQLKR